jgi:hypothetical protein
MDKDYRSPSRQTTVSERDRGEIPPRYNTTATNLSRSGSSSSANVPSSVMGAYDMNRSDSYGGSEYGLRTADSASDVSTTAVNARDLRDQRASRIVFHTMPRRYVHYDQYIMINLVDGLFPFFKCHPKLQKNKVLCNTTSKQIRNRTTSSTHHIYIIRRQELLSFGHRRNNNWKKGR